jgi:hypothetical protein
MPAKVKWKTWLPWCELSGTERGTPEEFQSLLRRYRRSSLLVACARISVALNFGPDGGTPAEMKRAAAWVPTLFPPALVPNVQAMLAAGRIIFFQSQLRYMASELLRLDPAPDETLPAIEDHELGEILLRAGELLYTPPATFSEELNKLDKLANELAQFLPIYEIDLPTDPFLPLLRFYIFVTVNVARLPEADKLFDVYEEFERAFGISLKIYYELVFAFVIHARNERDNQATNSAVNAGLAASWFSRTTVPPSVLEPIFALVSFTLENPPPAIVPIGYADFEILKRQPYFRYAEILYCLDYDYSLGKLESNALWGVLRKLPRAQQEPYLSYWGHVFEDYVAWVFENYAANKKNTFYKSPRYEDDPLNEICDAIVVCGQTAVLIEAKLATCKVSVRYSGDYALMRQYLEEKLVVGDTRRVGVAQLLHTIETIATADPSRLPPWLRNVRKFIPLIITRDEIGSCWGINGYLDARFDEQLNRKAFKGYSITPLVSMSVATLERAVHALERVSLSTILEDRIQSDRNLRRPFEAASNYVPRGMPRGMGAHFELFHTVMQEVIADFGMTEPTNES